MTSNINFLSLRLLAAILITVSGVGQIAMLWFEELTGAALITALMGVVYIIIGIGLQGQSRFTLFMSIGIPAAAGALVINSAPEGSLNMLQITRLVVDLAVILCSAIVLASTRKSQRTA